MGNKFIRSEKRKPPEFIHCYRCGHGPKRIKGSNLVKLENGTYAHAEETVCNMIKRAVKQEEQRKRAKERDTAKRMGITLPNQGGLVLPGRYRKK